MVKLRAAGVFVVIRPKNKSFYYIVNQIRLKLSCPNQNILF